MSTDTRDDLHVQLMGPRPSRKYRRQVLMLMKITENARALGREGLLCDMLEESIRTIGQALSEADALHERVVAYDPGRAVEAERARIVAVLENLRDGWPAHGDDWQQARHSAYDTAVKIITGRIGELGQRP